MTDSGRAIAAAMLAVLAAGGVGAGEDWPGLGGTLRRNASAVDVPPAKLAAVWRRAFPATMPIHDVEAEPPNFLKLPGAKGSRNLAIARGHVALIAADAKGLPCEDPNAYLTALDAATGRTVNCVRIKARVGNNRVYRWPYNTVSASSDTMIGAVVTRWDAATGILFTGQCAYESSYTAYLPLANADGYEPGGVRPAVAAYAELAGKHPDYRDAFGRTRAEQQTILGVGVAYEGLKPWAWGLSGFVAGGAASGKGKASKYDADWETLFDRQGSSFYNTSAYFDVAPDGPLIGITKGAAWGHNTAGDAYLFSKHAGMKAVASWPQRPRGPGGVRLRPFTHGGVVLGNGRVFLAGPADDRDGYGGLGTRRPEGCLPRVDQGLHLWAYDLAVADRKPNGGLAGAAAAETATLAPAFCHRFPSRYEPTDDIDSWGQSYYECDGFYRPKAMAIDGKGVWAAWKPNQAGPVELIHATDEGAKAFPLNVGAGCKGVDLWPKLSVGEVGGRKLIVYYTGWAKHRRRVMPEDPEAVLSKYGYRNTPWGKLPERTRRSFLGQARRTGVWTDELLPPRAPAELAVFDADAGRVRWTYDVSARHPSLPANGFWTYIDRSHMVLAGRWAYVAWVDTTAPRAMLRLLAFDVAADAPEPVVRAVPLGFPSAGSERSILTDIAAVDGRLYALVTQSRNLWIRDPRWKAQHVIALEK